MPQALPADSREAPKAVGWSSRWHEVRGGNDTQKQRIPGVDG